MSNMDVFLDVCVPSNLQTVNIATPSTDINTINRDNQQTENNVHNVKRQRLLTYPDPSIAAPPTATTTTTTTIAPPTTNIRQLNDFIETTPHTSSHHISHPSIHPLIVQETEDEISSMINNYEERSAEELLAWQEAQISRCIMDNTVNRVVESYLAFFDQTDADTSNSVGLEESAISMAINEHGLQQFDADPIIESLSMSAAVSVASGHHHYHHDHLDQGTPSPISLSDRRLNQTASVASTSCSSSLSSSSPSSSSQSSSTSLLTSTSTTMHQLTGSSNAPDKRQTIDQNGSTGNGADGNDHLDFMEAAIAVAIQKKGLAPYR